MFLQTGVKALNILILYMNALQPLLGEFLYSNDQKLGGFPMLGLLL